MDTYRKLLASHDGLSKRMSYGRGLLERVRTAAAQRSTCSRNEICAYVAGSLGRLETGQISDLDVFLFAHRKNKQVGERSINRLEEILVLSELIQVNSELSLPAFSGDGRYFKIHEVSELLAGTGTSIDDSENLFTTRLLLLLESKCIVNDELYTEVTKETVDMYFRDGRGRKGYRPIFLLNDILRYWRTICLNYERTRSDLGKPWWKKNLNLKFSRKLTVFSTILAILVDRIDTYAAFSNISTLTPMERLAYALDKLDDNAYSSEFIVFLNNYEDFLAAKSHSELEELEPTNANIFSAKAQHFDDLLHSIFDSPKLDPQLVRYMLI